MTSYLHAMLTGILRRWMARTMKNKVFKWFGWVGGTAIALLSAFIVFLVLFIGVRPSGPYDPLSSVRFFFHQGGMSKEIEFSPMFFRNHEISIVSAKGFPSKEKFNWKVRAEVFRYGIKIDDRLLKEKTRGYLRNSLDACNKLNFEWIHVWDIIPGRARVRLTVLEPDEKAASYADDFVVIVRPSWYR